MPQFLRIPWIQWNRFRVGGEIREKGSQRPLAGLCVRAFDKDLVKDDFLGEAETDAQGRFDIRFTDADFKDFLETRPDLYLCVFVPGQTDPIVDTSVVRPVVGVSGQRIAVTSDAEARAGPCDDHGTDVVSGFELRHDPPVLAVHPARPGVRSVGSVEPDGRHSVVNGETRCFQLHVEAGRSSGWSAIICASIPRWRPARVRRTPGGTR